MAHQLYRKTSLGNSLQESLEELIQNQRITPQLAHGVLLRFDKAINSGLSNGVNKRIKFRGHLKTYKCNNDGWTIFLRNVVFKELIWYCPVCVDNVKIIARDAKSGATG